jgi:S-adenosylmethionine uptake transporter
MVIASFLFATMGVCVKLASAHYSAAEIVFYRGLTGAVMIGMLGRWQRGTLRTPVPSMHFWRSLTGVMALSLWFYSISGLPLAMAMTLNYMSSVWMAMFLMGGAMLLGTQRVDARLVATSLLGFAGVALILRPTVEQNELWYGLIGLLSGMVSAMAYLQVTALGRAGEPEYRIVFYFSVGGIIAGAVGSSWLGWHTHTLAGLALLLAVGLLATVAQILMTRAYSIGRALVNASLQYLGIAFSFGYGVVLFNDRITWTAMAGMLLIVGGGVRAAQVRSESMKMRSPPSES